MRPTAAPLLLATLLTATALSACGSGSGSDPDTVKVSFKQSTDNSIRVMDTYLGEMKELRKANPGKKVELVPIKAPDSEYYTKLQQMLRSPKTAPDLVYEDTFLINSDITSGYLKPLDPYLDKWPDWNQFVDTAQSAAKAQDGKTYGVPDGTDTRGLWFDKGIFKKAGLPADWQPKTWDEVLAAARTIKAKVPGVTPLNVYTGKPAGEAATMQASRCCCTGRATVRRPSVRHGVEEVDRGQSGLQGRAHLRAHGLQGEAGPRCLGRPGPELPHERPRRTDAQGQARHQPGRQLAAAGLAEGRGARVAEWGRRNSASRTCRRRPARLPAR